MGLALVDGIKICKVSTISVLWTNTICRLSKAHLFDSQFTLSSQAPISIYFRYVPTMSKTQDALTFCPPGPPAYAILKAIPVIYDSY